MNTRIKLPVSLVLLLVLCVALELVNWTTSEGALLLFLGRTQVIGLYIASLLALAFCGVDLLCLWRITTPAARAEDESKTVVLMLVMWVVGTLLNAVLTYFSLKHTMSQTTAWQSDIWQGFNPLDVLPVALAGGVWVTRVSLIWTLASELDRRLHPALAPKLSPVREYRPEPVAVPAPQKASLPEPALEPGLPRYARAADAGGAGGARQFPLDTDAYRTPRPGATRVTRIRRPSGQYEEREF